MRQLFFCLMLFLPLSAIADAVTPPQSFDAFARLPILHDGRVKPLDSFARVELKRISGHDSYEGRSAIAWLAELCFSPREAMRQPVFAITDSRLLPILQLTEREGDHYSFMQLSEPLSRLAPYLTQLAGKNKQELSSEQKALVQLYANGSDFAQLLESFTLLLPFHLPVEPQGQEPKRFLDWMVQRQSLEEKMKGIVHQKGVKLDGYTAEEQTLAESLFRLDAVAATGQSNTLLRVIPPTWDGAQEWLAPWMVMQKGAGSPATGRLFKTWEALISAYQQGDVVAFSQQSHFMVSEVSASPGVRNWALALEVYYNQLKPLADALALYGLAIVTAGIALWRGSMKLTVTSYSVLLAAACIHGLAIVSRMLILMRPPVSTLYESMIFVSLVTALLGLWFERKRKSIDGILVSGIIAALLLLAADVFAGDSDTLEVLVAVLNTNFWLATHVVCITTGYGLSLVTGTLAHVYLVRRAINPRYELSLLQRRTHSIALTALLFTAVGTMLGGIWADQSWGRFWGWDPKENGALWIVLWLIWLLHGKVTGQLRELSFMACAAALNLVVMFAWVGVNLLSIGLHSYGFTDTAATGLGIFSALEVLFVSVTMAIILMGRTKNVA